MNVHVFVYGTLLRGEKNHGVVRPYVRKVEAGSIRGRLYNNGMYPGLVLGEEGITIQGEWLTINAIGLPILDRLEGYYGPNRRLNEYERVWVSDQEKKIEGWGYVWKHSKGLPEIHQGSWRNRRRR